MARRKAKKTTTDPARQKFQEAMALTERHPLFSPLVDYAQIIRVPDGNYPVQGFADVTAAGTIRVHPKRRAETEEWAYVLAHCLLHLGFGHFQQKERPEIWNLACDVYIARFLADFKFGRCPSGMIDVLNDLPADSEERLYEFFLENGVEERFQRFGTGNPGASDMVFTAMRPSFHTRAVDWKTLLGVGLRQAVTSAVNVAAGEEPDLGAQELTHSSAQRARAWFISSYPLLGSLAASFKILEDPKLCQNLEISVAAVDMELKEIYINPAAGLSDDECRFVVAHELLHVGLRHDTRRAGRDPFLWNVACDFVINGWLVEMRLGDLPAVGGLYDPELKGESAESIYDMITTDLRRIRKLATLRGTGACDILEPRDRDCWGRSGGTDLDAFYRRCLTQGLEYHQTEGRGLLPQGLIEEIRALAQPPIPWDVELARWFDGHFQPLEKTRTYARPSRRQSSTPDIPRPRHAPLWEAEEDRTFGVVLDTSGSMDRNLLARALGAITSYSLSRDVGQIRLIFCDAAAYDEGYVKPEALGEQVKVKGRGGTVLQPGINLLERAEDFPKEGPILIITDGGCDRLVVKRDHAFLMPSYGRLPFAPKGKVFRIQ